MSPRLSSLTFAIAALVPSLAGILALQSQRLERMTSRQEVDYVQEEQFKKLTLDLQKKIPAFGFDNLIADWNFLQYVQYFGDNPAREETGYGLVPDFFEIMVDRDPRFVPAYLQLSTASSVFAGRPDRTVILMDRVLDSISPTISPLAPYIWIYKGVDEILFLGNLKAARHSYQMAADWAQLQGEEALVASTSSMAEFLATNPDSRQVQIAAWAQILFGAADPKTRQHAIQQIQALEAEVRVTPDGRIEIEQ